MPQSISPDIKRICIVCGQKFHPHARKQYCCNEIKVRQCIICGEDFEVKCCKELADRCICSKKECVAKYATQKRMQAAGKLKRTCKYCGKEFSPRTFQQVYCDSAHYNTCVVCGKEFEVNVQERNIPQTCSDKCRYELMVSKQDKEAMAQHLRESLLEKYGVANPRFIEGVEDKMKQTSMERYGAEWYTQTEEYRKKTQQTCQEKYGVDHHLQAPEVIDRRIATVQEKYGVSNVFQSEDIKKRIIKSVQEIYGVASNVSQSPEIRAKIVENNLKKYGVAYPMMLPEFQEKAVQTNEQLYGRRAYTQQHIKNIQEWYLFINDPREYIETHYENPPRSKELAEDLGVDFTTVDEYLERFQAKDCIRRAKSLMEEEISAFLKFLDPDIKIINNDKTQIKPLELDIYLPELNFAIECNPTCTHNSSIADPWGDSPKPSSYHKIKSDKCDEKHIQLFHIFGYEWTHKSGIIKSMLRNIVKQNENVVYARKCKIAEVSGMESAMFLDANHRQGSANSYIRLGLYFNEELVSLMTFGKMRATIGTGNEDLADCYELVRFCSKLNTTVVGGSSKLFKHFVKEYHPARVRSFSDRAHTSGKLYAMLGFYELRRSAANYVWVDVISDIGYNRVNAQKHNLKKFLRDESIDLSKTESQIMVEHGFVQVFDSGTITWEWKKPVGH